MMELLNKPWHDTNSCNTLICSSSNNNNNNNKIPLFFVVGPLARFPFLLPARSLSRSACTRRSLSLPFFLCSAGPPRQLPACLPPLTCRPSLLHLLPAPP